MEPFFLSIFLLLSLLTVSIVWFIKTSPGGGKFPPGPRGLPILGYLPFLDRNLHHQFTNLARKYGPIFQLHLGNKLCVVMTSPALIKQVVRDHDAVFSHRDAPIAAVVISYGLNDIAWSSPGPQWRALRKTLVRELLSGESLYGSRNLRRDEVRKAVREVYSRAGQPVHICELSLRTELNITTNLLWGGLLEGEEGDRIREEFQVAVTNLIDLLGKPNVSDFFPFIARFDVQGIKRQAVRYMQSLDRVFEGVITQHRSKLSGGDVVQGKKDFLQILLKLEETQPDSDFSMTDEMLKAMLKDVVAGGTDTSASTIEWAMAELMNNPKAMEKAQDELSDIVGLDNIVEEDHIPKLKYLEAVLKETLRLHPALPLLVPRSPIQSSTIGGYTIPKNSRVFINVSSIHNDPQFWDNPTEFQPERFLEGEEKFDFSGNNFKYLPFGSGRRVCAGLPLAERIIMYFLASLVHSFDWKLPKEGDHLDMSEIFGIVLRKSVPLVAVPAPRLSDSGLYE